MDYLIKNKKLKIIYQPGKGAWTYHLQIPNTKHIVGKWGFLKVSGTIDNYPIESKNLFTIKGQEKLLSVNETIRKSINKTSGDTVTVSLYLTTPKEVITEKIILETFNDSGVLKKFKSLASDEKDELISEILSCSSEEKQIKMIEKYIQLLSAGL